MRLALDTNAVVSAMRSPKGASAALLMEARRNRLTLVANGALALEYEAICRLAEHRLASGLSLDQVVDIRRCRSRDVRAGRIALYLATAVA